MASTKSTRIEVCLNDVFYALLMLDALRADIEEGFLDAEYADEENDPQKQLSLFSIDETVDSIIVLFTQYFSPEEDTALADFLKLKYGFEFEERSVIDTTGGTGRRENSKELFVAVPAKTLFTAIGMLLLFTRPDIDGVVEVKRDGQEYLLDIELAKLHFGRKRLVSIIGEFSRLIGKRKGEFQKFSNDHPNVSVEVWVLAP